MQKCCVKGCDSHKYNGTKNIGYFQFPIHNDTLLRKWLKQIDLPNWKPSACNRICSMHFRDEDTNIYPNRKQPYLKPTSIPTIFSHYPIEIINPNNTSPPLKSNNCHLQIPTNMLNVIGNTPTVLQSSPVILIDSLYSGEFPIQFPTQLIAQNVNQTAVNNSVHISTDYIKQIGAQQFRMPLHNSLPYIKHINAQDSLTDFAKSPLQITRNNVQIMTAQCQKQILLQTSLQYSKQTALQSSGEIKESKQVPMLIASKDPGCNTEEQTSDSPLMAISQSRWRKILPKPQSFNSDTLTGVRSLQNCQSSSTTNSIPKPDILIIPRVENFYPNDSGKVVPFRYPGNKRPILRISIYKEYDSKNTQCPFDKAGTADLSSDSKMHDASIEDMNSPTKEMTIENTTTNKAVTFKLDPRTGEIVVTTRQLCDSINDEAGSKSTRTERKLDDLTPSATKFRQLYLKGQQECIALQRRLRVLRQRHKQEQEEIQKLEEHLINLDDKVEKMCREDPPELRRTKRKETENIVQSNDYETLLRGVKKIKQNVHTGRYIPVRKDLSTIANCRSEEQGNQSRANCNNGVSIFSKMERDSLDILEEDIVNKIGDNCEIVVCKTEKTSSDIHGDFEYDDTDYKAEILNAEYLME